jgi:hypothetical protein
VKYRIADRGLAASASDLARFLRFNLFETSKSQLAKFLSTPDNKPHWNVALGKAAGHRLVLESLPPGDELAILIQEDSAEGRELRAALDEQVAAMPRSGILQLCELAAMLDRHPCEPSVASYAAQSRMRTEEQIITPHLGMRGGSYPSMINFVYGHTHSFQAPWTAKLNGARVSVANTGAFHRVVDEAGFESRAAGRPRSEALRSLTPEDLPACYTYVLVQDEHAPMSLLRWYQPEGAAGFAVDAGDSRCR